MPTIGTHELDETDAELILDVETWGFRVSFPNGETVEYDPRSDHTDRVFELVTLLGKSEDASFERYVIDAKLKASQTEQRGRQPPLLAFTAAYKFDDLQKDLVHRGGGWVTDFYYNGEWYDTVGFEYDAAASQFGTVTFTVGD